MSSRRVAGASSRDLKNYHPPSVRGASPQYVGADLPHNPLEPLFIPGVLNSEGDHMAWIMVEAVSSTLVQSNGTYGPGPRRDPQCRLHLFGLGENKGSWGCQVDGSGAVPFCSWGNRLLGDGKLERSLRGSQRLDRRQTKESISLYVIYVELPALPSAAMWEVGRTKRAPSRRVRKGTILRDGW